MILTKFKVSQNYSLFTLLERAENAHRRMESLETDGENPLYFGIYRRFCHFSFSKVSLYKERLCFEHVNGTAICIMNPS